MKTGIELGKEKRRSGRIFICIGSFLIVVFIAVVVNGGSDKSSFNDLFIFLFAGLGSIALGIWLIFGWKKQLLKKDPKILFKEKQHYENIEFENEYVIVSKEYISFKQQPDQIFKRDEVLNMFYNKFSVRGNTFYLLEVKTVRMDDQLTINQGRFNIKDLIKGHVIDKQLEILGSACPYACIGKYDPGYVEHMRKMWREAQQAKLENMPDAKDVIHMSNGIG